MKAIGLSVLTMIIFFITADFLGAAEATDKEAGISIWYPGDWKMNTDEDTMLLLDPAGEIMVIYIVLETVEIKQALKKLNETLTSLGVEVTGAGEAKEKELNGMQGIYLDAQGRVEGLKVGVGVMFIYTPANKLLLFVDIVENGKYEKHEKTLARILTGIKPL